MKMNITYELESGGASKAKFQDLCYVGTIFCTQGREPRGVYGIFQGRGRDLDLPNISLRAAFSCFPNWPAVDTTVVTRVTGFERTLSRA